MNISEAIKILELHNAWRRGAETELVNPKKLGEAIDIAINELKVLEKSCECDPTKFCCDCELKDQ